MVWSRWTAAVWFIFFCVVGNAAFKNRLKSFLLKTFLVTRLNDARPTFFLWLPCAWGIMLARDSIFSVEVAFFGAVFAVPCSLMYSAGCIISDFFDRDIDILIPRTKDRLLASGQYSPFLALLIALCFGLISFRIVLMFNDLAVGVAIVGGIGILLYPFAKRYVAAPQVVLGLVANIGVLFAYAACNKFLSIGAFAMYVGGVYLTCVYDTMYAYQDRREDERLGIKSMAVLYGDKTKDRLKSFAAIAFVCFAVAGFMEAPKMHFGYYVILALDCLWMLKIVGEIDLEKPAECYRALMLSTVVEIFVLLACVVGRMF